VKTLLSENGTPEQTAQPARHSCMLLAGIHFVFLLIALLDAFSQN
jgi:hypothetical protein